MHLLILDKQNSKVHSITQTHNDHNIVYTLRFRKPVTCSNSSNKSRPISIINVKTRKLSYRKDDRAIYIYVGALKIFESPTVTFAKIFNGLFFWSIWMCVQNLKFVALFGWTLWMYLPNMKFVDLPVLEIIGVTQKIWAVTGYAQAPFSQNF